MTSNPAPLFQTLNVSSDIIQENSKTSSNLIFDNLSKYNFDGTPYSRTQNNINEYDRGRTCLKGTLPSNEVSKIYFSVDNINRLQKRIKKEIYIRTNKKIILEDDQEESDLLIIMRYVYMNYNKFLDNQIIRQVKYLNEMTIREIIPDMLTNIDQYYHYIKELDQPIKPIMLPVNVNNAGRKTLPALTTLWR